MLLNLKKKRIYLSFALFPLSPSLSLSSLKITSHTSACVRKSLLKKKMEDDQRDTERERERENEQERERETRCGLRVLSCACLFIYFCSGLCALYTLDGLSRFPSLSLSRLYTNRQISGSSRPRKKKMRMKKTKRKRELQEGEYGRNCRQSLSSSSTDYNIAVRYKTKEQPSHDRRERKNKKNAEKY